MLFRQIRLITKKNSPYNRYIIFVDCNNYKDKQPELEKILHNGFFVNHRKYVFTEKSSSMARNAIIGFVDATISDELNNRITMDIDIEKTVLDKYIGYRGLFFSSCFNIEGWKPYIVVVDDYTKVVPDQNIKYVIDVEKECINKTGEPYIWREKGLEQGSRDVKIIPFDGSSVHSPEITRFVKEKIDMRETPTSIMFRLPFFKGLSHEIDFKKWFKVNNVTHITDFWGNKHDINNVDLIVPISLLYASSYFFL